VKVIRHADRAQSEMCTSKPQMAGVASLVTANPATCRIWPRHWDQSPQWTDRRWTPPRGWRARFWVVRANGSPRRVRSFRLTTATGKSLRPHVAHE